MIMQTLQTFNKFPDLGRYFQRLKQLDKIEDQLWKINFTRTIFGHGIYEGLMKGNIRGIVKMIQEQAKDNLELVAEIIDNDTLLNQILNF